MKQTKYKRIPVLLALFIAVFLTGCGATSPQKTDYAIPFEHFGDKQVANGSSRSTLTLSPRDSLDVMFHFDTIQKAIYRIAAHDKVSIKYLSAPIYDNIYQVRPDGYFSLPLLGDFKAEGLTVAELERDLLKAYKNILKRPAFFVSLAEYQVHLKEIRQSLEHPNLGQARQITVREDYRITLPFVGELSVDGKSIKEITEEANAKYKKIVPGMSVDILLRESYPREIYVFGEVNKPGSYRVNGPTSIFAAIALAGGPSHEARLDTVLTMTKEGNEMAARTYNFNDLIEGRIQAVNLNFDDIVYVPRSRLSSAAQVVDYVSRILLFRGIDLGFTYRLNE